MLALDEAHILHYWRKIREYYGARVYDFLDFLRKLNGDCVAFACSATAPDTLIKIVIDIANLHRPTVLTDTESLNRRELCPAFNLQRAFQVRTRALLIPIAF